MQWNAQNLSLLFSKWVSFVSSVSELWQLYTPPQPEPHQYGGHLPLTQEVPSCQVPVHPHPHLRQAAFHVLPTIDYFCLPWNVPLSRDKRLLSFIWSSLREYRSVPLNCWGISIFWMQHSLFILSPVDRHLGLLQIKQLRTQTFV